jgi:choline monooxygenase
MNLEVDPDISVAKTINKAVYLSEELFEQTKESIFSRCFLYVGQKAMFTEDHNTIPVEVMPDFLNEPLVLTKQPDGALSCLSNVCTHRGNLLATKACKARKLVCGYHGRQFALDGTFLSMPGFNEVKNFPCSTDHLAQLPLVELGPMLFTTFNSKAKAADFFGPLQERLHWFPWNELVAAPEHDQTFTLQANWALYCENYLEGFHIPFVHQSLNQVLDFQAYSTTCYTYSNVQVGIAKSGETTFNLPETSVDFGKEVAAYYFWIFPNIMVNVYPWGVSLNCIEPVSVNQTRVCFYTFVMDETLHNQGAGSALDVVELEDEAIVQQVQKGLKSRFYSQGRFSVQHEQGPHHFHRLLQQFLSNTDQKIRATSIEVAQST